FHVLKCLLIRLFECLQMKIAGCRNTRNQPLSAGRSIVVDHHYADILHHVIRRQWKNQQLHHGHDENQRQQGFVPENLAEFFVKQKENRPHVNLTLKFFKLTTRKKIAIPSRTSVSIHTAEKPSPLIMIDLTIRKYHRAGTILEISCSTFGMFSMGNINPLKSNVGSSMPSNEMSIAACCVLTRTEMNKPREREVMMNNVLSRNNSGTLPRIGNLRTKTLSKRIDTTLPSESIR